jgi:hypothetical protein
MTALQDNGDRKAGDKSAGAEHLGQVLREMTAGKRQPRQDCQERTTWRGQPGQDSQRGQSGKPGKEGEDRTAT